MNVDYLIRNGRVIDPASGTDGVEDVAIRGDRIVPAAEGTAAACTVDASGCWVLPGLIDYHTHLFHGGSTFGTWPDLLLFTGVTTAVDMGTAGYINLEAFRRGVVQTSCLQIYGFLNVSPLGQPGGGLNEPLSEKVINRSAVVDAALAHPDLIRGIKVRVSKSIVGELGIRPLEMALKAAEDTRLPLCVHVTDAPIPMGELASMLRPGDVFSHVYHGTGHTILENGVIAEGVLRARKRGIIFDLGNGRINFSRDVAAAAAAQGFWPDTVTSDSTPATLFRSRAMKDLPFVLSKLICMGMPLIQAIRAVTETPARLLGKAGQIGTLAPGAAADVAIFRPLDHPVTFADSKGATWQGSFQLLHQATFHNGKVCACAGDFMIE